MKTILIVDDEIQVAKALCRLLRRSFAVEVVQSGSAAISRLEQHPVDLVLSDFRMPGMDGAELLSEVMKRWPATVRVLISGFADCDRLLGGSGGAQLCRFLRKPWNDSELPGELQQLLEVPR